MNAVVAFLVLALGATLAFGQQSMRAAHGGLAMLFVVTSLVAAVTAVLYALRSGRRGLIGHGVGLVVLALIQYSLGEIGTWPIVHIILGVLIVIGAIALYVMATRPSEAKTSPPAA